MTGCERHAAGEANPVRRSAASADVASAAAATYLTPAPPLSAAQAPNPATDALTTAARRARAFPEDGARLFPRTRNVWVRPKPDDETEWTGYLWWGTSVKLREPEPVSGPGCATWYRIEPDGYVCTEGRRATVDPNDPLVRGLFPHGFDVSSPYPHPFYGESTEAERYLALPSEEEQRLREWDYRQQLDRIERARSGHGLAPELAGVDITPAASTDLFVPTLPGSLQLPHTRLVVHSSTAWTSEVRHLGRDWLLTDDLTWVPKDRIRPYAPVTFHGIQLGVDARLPLALFRKSDQPSYRLTATGQFELDGHQFKRLSWIELSGTTRTVGEDVFHETINNTWVMASDDAVIPAARELTPWGEKLQQPAPLSYGPSERHSWIDVSINGGWLMAYENTRPVYVTLISAGRGGPPHRGKDPLSTASTPTGRFKINGKFAISTMIAPNEVAHSGVAWSQNFLGPYSIHTAYWHNAWGEPHSGGCINVAPIDGQWLFQFSDPPLPEGWHGVRSGKERGPATVLMIRR